MDLTILNKTVFNGTPEHIRRYRGLGISQLQILHSFMEHQNLQQCIRVVRYPDVTIECRAMFGLYTVNITIPAIPLAAKGEIISEAVIEYLFIIYGIPEERITIGYSTNSPVFEIEAVTCSDGGTGDIAFVLGTKLYGTYTKCWDGMLFGSSSGAIGGIQESISKYYIRLYNAKEILTDSVYNFPDWLEFNAPVDKPPCSETLEKSSYEWSKTLDDFIITAFLFYPDGPTENPSWAVACTVNGTDINWSPYASGYYPTAGFQYMVCPYSVGCEFSSDFTDTHIGFDIWKEDEDYFCGLISDQNETLRIFKVNRITLNMDLQEEYVSTVRETYLGEEDDFPYAWMRLIGYGYTENAGHICYWCELGRDSVYYIENMVTGSIEVIDLGDSETESVTPGLIETGIWNPITRTAKFVFQSSGGISEGTFDRNWTELIDYWFYRVGSSVDYSIDGICTSHPGVLPNLVFSPEIVDPWPRSPNPGTYDPLAVGYRADRPLDPRPEDTYMLMNFDFRTRSTIFHEYGSTYNRGKSIFIDNEFDHGDVESFTKTTVNTYWTITSNYVTGGQAQQFPVDGPWSTSNCNPVDAKDYEFLAGVFSNQETIAYKYQDVNIVAVQNCISGPHGYVDSCMQECKTWNDLCGGEPCYKQFPDPDVDCACLETNWTEHIVGDNNIADAADPSFPHHYGWTAILLDGKARVDTEAKKITVAKSNWVIYRNLDTSELFMIQSDGTKVVLGSQQRAFFQQYKERIRVVTPTV